MRPTLAYLYLYSADAMGKDRLGRMYLGMANRAVEEYSLCQRATAEKSEEVLSDMDRATNNTVWGVFNVATYELSSRQCDQILIRYPG